jgi:hypothetical protein
MIVSRVGSESIRNMNKTEDLNKNINEICKMMKQHPNMLDMLKYTARNENNRKKENFKS